MSTEEQIIGAKGIESITAFYEKNKKNITIAGIALILLSAGLWYYNSIYKPGMEEEANDSLFLAKRAFDQDSLNLALNGNGIQMGMMDIADDFGGTSAGELATYYCGNILLKQGKFDEALDYLEDADLNDEFMAAQVITLQGDCLSEQEKYEDAADKYMQAANKRENDVTTPYALLKAGIAYEEAKEYDDAVEAYERLFKDFSGTKHAQNAELRIARAKALAEAN
jgi:tetratricopeptide (TPR) repeat protein